jgi:hypothetical protein
MFVIAYPLFSFYAYASILSMFQNVRAHFPYFAIGALTLSLHHSHPFTQPHTFLDLSC